MATQVHPADDQPWKNRLGRFVLDKALLAVIVFLSTNAANLWFEKQKAAAAIRLNDSTLITEGATRLWKEIAKLEMEYSDLHQVKRKQWFAKTMLRESGQEFEADIRQRARALDKRKDEMLRAVSAEEHVIGEPMVRHMLVYVHLLDGYYEHEAKAWDASSPEAQKYNQESAEGLLKTLHQMRLDVVATRNYALQQVNR